ncbi:hypothetical protein JL720_16076 [Aureococcus anophagefferens]|nr:hypothetical protein JL720_16076 [Aureococcus anophagefferens]
MSEDGPIWGARALPVTRGDDRAVEERDAPAFLRGDRGSPTTRDAEAKLAVAKARLDAAREQREQRSAYEHQRPSYEQQRSAPRRAGPPREIDLQRTSGGFTALRGALGDGAAAAAKPPPDDTPPGPPTPAATPRPPDPPTPAASPRPPDPPTPAASPRPPDPPTPASPKPATKDESKEKLRQLRQYTRDLLKEKEALEQRLSSAEQVALERRLSSAAAERPPPGDDRDSALASTGSTASAAARARVEIARALERVHVACSRGTVAKPLVRPWHARCRWGVGRLRLFELFNHGAALPALAALAAYDDARDDGGDDDAAPGRVSVAGAIGARHTHDRGAVVRDAAGRRRSPPGGAAARRSTCGTSPWRRRTSRTATRATPWGPRRSRTCATLASVAGEPAARRPGARGSSAASSRRRRT